MIFVETQPQEIERQTGAINIFIGGSHVCEGQKFRKATLSRPHWLGKDLGVAVSLPPSVSLMWASRRRSGAIKIIVCLRQMELVDDLFEEWNLLGEDGEGRGAEAAIDHVGSI